MLVGPAHYLAHSRAHSPLANEKLATFGNRRGRAMKPQVLRHMINNIRTVHVQPVHSMDIHTPFPYLWLCVLRKGQLNRHTRYRPAVLRKGQLNLAEMAI